MKYFVKFQTRDIIQVIIKNIIVIKAALKRSCNLTNTPALVFQGYFHLQGGKKKKRREIHRWLFLQVSLSDSFWVVTKAVEVAAETSSNSYDIKNRTDVFPVMCSVGRQSETSSSRNFSSCGKFVSAELKVRLSPGSRFIQNARGDPDE